MLEKKNLRIIFFGTPDFASTSLKQIHENGYQIVAVVTAPDKPMGRGLQMNISSVKKTANELDIPILQPKNLKAPEFLNELRSFKADLQIVIAFRMLPELVWGMPKMGTFNLHASYLPNYRGAAPINRAIMNGETETGVSTFFLVHEIDQGQILLQRKIAILPEDNAGTLHDKLMHEGARLVLESLELICTENYELKPQETGEFKHAPKLFTEDCKIDWNKTAVEIHNHIRGLSPYPVAFTEFQGKKLKVYASSVSEEDSTEIGKIEVADKSSLYGHCRDKKIQLTDVQIEGKKRMPVKDFINGLKINP
ncbi:MAG: methionyl-tRNA formyltransferase [Bacteroidia bacterium]